MLHLRQNHWDRARRKIEHKGDDRIIWERLAETAQVQNQRKLSIMPNFRLCHDYI